MVPVMIGKDYFKRQAKTLRKMVKVAQDPVVADRLCEMAEEFESRADTGRDDRMHGHQRHQRAADEGRG
jgi:hypothetical protein